MIELCLAASLHLGIGDGWNAIHPCARYVTDNVTVGAYLNSEEKLSAYVSNTFHYDAWFFELGAVTGYSGGIVVPMARAGYNFSDNATIFAGPAYSLNKGAGLVVGLEWSVRCCQKNAN